MVRSLRHLTNRRLTAAETERALFQFQGMDDRACAVIVGAMLDHSLERLLLSTMRESLSKKDRERLFFGTGPLGSLAVKIQIASAFRVIEQEIADDLDVLRNIRNVFAHASHGITFRNRSIRESLRELHGARPIEVLTETFAAMKRFESARGRFLIIGVGYVNLLDDMRQASRAKARRRTM